VTDGPGFTFLAVDDVLSLHEVAINTWGGTHGIRDRGLLESAVGAATNVAPYDEAANMSVLAKAMIDVAERRWPDPRRALADVLRRLSGAR
jgi:hypothetical protein